jgi:hypothetical protein
MIVRAIALRLTEIGSRIYMSANVIGGNLQRHILNCVCKRESNLDAQAPPLSVCCISDAARIFTKNSNLVSIVVEWHCS